MTTADHVHQWIGAPNSLLITGVRTTKRPVIKPALPGLVMARPAVWVKYPPASAMPIAAPTRSSRRVGRRWTTRAMTATASRKRICRKGSVGYCVTASFTRTKVQPHTAVTTSIKRT